MTTRREIIKALCAISVLPVFAESTYDNKTIEKWAKKHALTYATVCIMYDKSFIDGNNDRYIATWPMNIARFKMRNSNELCKMAFEFPAKVRRVKIPHNPTKADFDKAKQQMYIQLKPFMIEYAKEQMPAHPEITVYV